MTSRIAIDNAVQLLQQDTPTLLADLEALVAHPSCAFPGHPAEPVLACAETTRALLQRCGLANARLVEIRDGYPLVVGDIGPDSAPTVVLYAHYDVQPAPASQGWATDPWKLTERNGRYYGRGAADNKSGIIMIAHALRSLLQHTTPPDTLPVHIKVVIEGDEEHGSPHLAPFLAAHPELVTGDAIVINDCGNNSTTSPTLEVSLRGVASCRVTVRALDRASHSGVFGGPAPDALLALCRMIASLHHDDGSVAVEGLHTYAWPGTTPTDKDPSEFRKEVGMLPGTQLLGKGPIPLQLWAQPSITVTGMDTPNLGAPNSLVAEASAKVSLRVTPGADPETELKIVMNHLRDAAPWGVTVEFTPLEYGKPFAADVTHSGFACAKDILDTIYNTETGLVGVGGSIPVVAEMQGISPDAAVVLWGAQDLDKARIHAADESIDADELARMTAALWLFLDRFADTVAKP